MAPAAPQPRFISALVYVMEHVSGWISGRIQGCHRGQKLGRRPLRLITSVESKTKHWTCKKQRRKFWTASARPQWTGSGDRTSTSSHIRLIQTCVFKDFILKTRWAAVTGQILDFLLSILLKPPFFKGSYKEHSVHYFITTLLNQWTDPISSHIKSTHIKN